MREQSVVDAPIPAREPGKPGNRRPGRARRGIGIARLLVWQLSLAAGVFAGLGPEMLRVPVASVAVALALITVGRRRNRWLDEWFVVVLGWLPRRSVRPIGPAGVVPFLLPRLDFEDSTTRGRTPMGVLHDGRGWVAVLALEFSDVLVRQPDLLPLGRIAELLEVDGNRLASVQLLTHSVADGVRGTLTTGPADAPRPPCARLVWLALRFDPLTRPDSLGHRENSVETVHKVLRRAASRAGELFDTERVRCRLLNAEEAQAALSRAALTDPADGLTAREGWRSWRLGDLAHTTYEVLGVSGADSMTALFALAGTLPALATATSVSVTRRGGGELELSVLMRVVTVAGRAAPVSDAGLRLCRRDGAHREGLLATLPLGGTPLGAPGVLPDSAITLPSPPPWFGPVRGRPAVLVRLFGAQPVRVGLFASPVVAQLLALRVATAGAEVHVITKRPATWRALTGADATTGAPIRLHAPGKSRPVANAIRPILVIDDVDGGAQGGWPVTGHWQTTLTLRPRIDAESARLLRSYDFTVLQGIAVDAADPEVAESLPENAARWLPRLAPQTLAVISGSRVELADLALTDAERAAFGIGSR